MNATARTLVALIALGLSAQAMAQITFYEGEGFRGRAFTAQYSVKDFSRTGFNDRAASVVIERGQWEVCEHRRFGGNCVVLTRGSYGELRSMRLSDRISSARLVSGRRGQQNLVPAPLEQPDYAWRRRPQERVYEAQVTSVRAVLAQDNRRCWIERDQYERQRGGRSDPGRMVAGAIIGAILGHQIGSGSGRDAATAGGAVAGAVIGAHSGRDDGYDRSYGRGVQRCESNFRGAPEYWDISYEHRGVEHWARMSDPPGRTILVNRRGEPRQ